MMLRKKYLTVLPAFMLMVALFGCAKVDVLPQLEVQVIDESGKPVSGACVGLFDSEAAWLTRVNPVQVWRRTDASGKVLFTDLGEIGYYVYVRFDGKDNALDEYSTLSPLSMNVKHLITIHIR